MSHNFCFMSSDCWIQWFKRRHQATGLPERSPRQPAVRLHLQVAGRVAQSTSGLAVWLCASCSVGHSGGGRFVCEPEQPAPAATAAQPAPAHDAVDVLGPSPGQHPTVGPALAGNRQNPRHRGAHSNHRGTIFLIHLFPNEDCYIPGDEQEPRLQSLPEECVREVLLRLSDHKDLQRAGEAWGVMQRVSDEERIWRELCHFHFTPAQLNKALEEATAAATSEDNTTTDWQQLYHKLRRVYGLREDYAEILSLCRNCRCLFWQSLGHPCIVERDIPELSERLGDSTPHVPIPPRAFLKFFSL
ncbi:hypothetical protein B566_EDAN016904 [Ephemera danica]|nr:hypothetical protein B566_EDAN016904 [Ephemera danica]